VDEKAIIGGNAGVRQRTHIGRSAMIGGMACVINDVIPYGLVGAQGNLAVMLILTHLI
jgi:UDP-N-acetylglucosamine acyltransferase